MAQLGDEALLQASESGDLFGVGECLDAGASASAQDANGFTALIKAVANGHTDVVDLLLARGAPVNTPAGTHTALRAATLNGQAALVDKLLKAGADASIVSNNARTPLMGACYPRHGVPEASTKACVELLLNDANGRRTLGWQNDDGDTALHLACFGAPAAALVLAKAGAPRDVLNNREETPDDLARRAGLRLDPGVPLPLPPAPAPAPPPQAPPPPAPRPKMLPLQKAKPPVRVPTGGKYAKPRGRAPLNAEGKPASWDPDLGEWVGACAASDMTFSVTPSPRRRRRGMPSLVLVASMAFLHVCYVRHRPQLVLLQYYRRPLPNNILIRTRRRRQEEEAQRDSEAARAGSVGGDVGLRQRRVGRRERQAQASGSEEAGAEEKGCCSSHNC